MNSKKVYLAVDLGAESGRVLAGEFDGNLLNLNVIRSFPNGPINLNGSIHWNTVGLYEQILFGLSKAQSQYGDSLVSLAVDSWGLDYGHLDAQGNLLGMPYHYRDSRTRPMIEKQTQLFPKMTLMPARGYSHFLSILFFSCWLRLRAINPAYPSQTAFFLPLT